MASWSFVQEKTNKAKFHSSLFQLYGPKKLQVTITIPA